MAALSLRGLGAAGPACSRPLVAGCRVGHHPAAAGVCGCRRGCVRPCWTAIAGEGPARLVSCNPRPNVDAVHAHTTPPAGLGNIGVARGWCGHTPFSPTSNTAWHTHPSSSSMSVRVLKHLGNAGSRSRLHMSAWTTSDISTSHVSRTLRDSSSKLHLHMSACTTSDSSASKATKPPKDSGTKLSVHTSAATSSSDSSASKISNQEDIVSGLHLHKSTSANSASKVKGKLHDGPGLEHFIVNGSLLHRPLAARELDQVSHPYLQPTDLSGHGRKVYFDVYGCQMNVSDTEIAWSVLKDQGYVRAQKVEEADVVLVMTCAIREGAEDKVWNKLRYLSGLKKKRMRVKNAPPIKIGVLGCMAERLKKKLVEQEKSVDVVAGPDSYRDLPRLLALVDGGETAVNVLLSMDETYADIVPVSLTTNRMSAYISIMRGCDNMCSYCIVPFTRGKERSRSIQSILEETQYLSDQGVKEITLLGQNVNSYRDVSHTTHQGLSLAEEVETNLARGFKTVYKLKKGGLRFADLLDKVSQVNPEMRIRFTSPHPKDFADAVLHLIKERKNICKQIHLPAQCGSSRVLELMRRGYTREAYLDLVAHIRSVIPGVSLSSDFICGFCSETEEEFQETLSILQDVKYNFCYLFPYSLREKTHAHRRLVDDVPQPVKLDRLNRMVKVFRSELTKINRAQVGQQQLVLVEGTSRRSELHLVGRNDGNTKVIFPNVEIEKDGCTAQNVQPGDYVSVMITDSSSQVLKGIPLSVTTLQAGA